MLRLPSCGFLVEGDENWIGPIVNMYGMLPCMCFIFLYVINTTAYHLSRDKPSYPKDVIATTMNYGAGQ